MDHTTAHLFNTQLGSRTLWFDGDTAYDPDVLLRRLHARNVKYVTQSSPIVEEYNRHASSLQEIHVKKQCRPLSKEWTIPDKYKTLDVVDFLSAAHDILVEGLPEEEILARERRLAQEIILYQRYKLDDVLRAIIWIINTLSSTDTVWGVGRGSSVSSYVLYVIGVHDVDSYTYGLNIDDFLHE